MIAGLGSGHSQGGLFGRLIANEPPHEAANSFRNWALSRPRGRLRGFRFALEAVPRLVQVAAKLGYPSCREAVLPADAASRLPDGKLHGDLAVPGPERVEPGRKIDPAGSQVGRCAGVVGEQNLPPAPLLAVVDVQPFEDNALQLLRVLTRNVLGVELGTQPNGRLGQDAKADRR